MVQKALRVSFWVLVCGLLLLAGVSDDGEPASPVNYGAGWVQPPTVGDITIGFRDEPLFSEERSRGSGARWVEEDAWRIHLESPHYFAGDLQPSGDYQVGLFFGPYGYSWRSKTRLLKLDSPIPVSSYSKAPPAVFLSAQHGAVCFGADFGGVSSGGICVPQRTHDALVQHMKKYAGRYVVLHSDVDLPAQLERLSEIMNQAVKRYAVLTGSSKPSLPMHMYVFKNGRTFDRMAELLHGLDGAHLGGFASPITGQAYVRSYLRDEPAVWPETELPASFVQLVLHELNHLQMQKVFKFYNTWPTWLSEGIAEAHSYQAMQTLEISGHAELDHAWRVGLKASHRYSRTPHIEDFLGGSYTVGSMYPSARAFIDEYRQRDRVSLLIERAEVGAAYPVVATRVEAVIREVLGSPEELLKRAIDSRPPVSDRLAVMGQWLNWNDGKLLLPPENSTAGVWRIRDPDDVVEFECEISFLDSGPRQFDIDIGGSQGTQSEFLLKIAIQPEGISLMHYRFGFWSTIFSDPFQETLAVGELNAPAWYRITGRHNPVDRTFNIKIPGHPESIIQLPEWAHSNMETCGLSAFDSALMLRKAEITLNPEE